MATLRASVSQEINCPAADLFEFIVDIPNLPSWAAAFDEIRHFSGAPLGVGSTWQSIAQFMGREVVTDNEVTEFVPGQLCVIYGEGPVFAGNNIWRVTGTAHGTAVFTLELEGETSGFLASLAAPFLQTQIQNQMASDLDNLKSLLER